MEGQRWNFFKVRPPVSICPVLVPTLRRQPAMVNPKFRGRASSTTMHPQPELEDLARSRAVLGLRFACVSFLCRRPSCLVDFSIDSSVQAMVRCRHVTNGQRPPRSVIVPRTCPEPSWETFPTTPSAESDPGGVAEASEPLGILEAGRRGRASRRRAPGTLSQPSEIEGDSLLSNHRTTEPPNCRTL